MTEWNISDVEIEAAEKLLLPDGAHFPEDAREVIRCWHSAEVSACPGSGKTTILLAKLKLLADRMPFEDNSGVCVLSHTNVAVDEIRKRLTCYEDKLRGFPNYIGTIQSFIDRFITMPYLRSIKGHDVQAVDDRTFAQHMLHKMKHANEYRTIYWLIKNRFEKSNNSRYVDELDYIQALQIRPDGTLGIANQEKPLAGSGKDSTVQYINLIKDLLDNERIITYRDAYSYAEKAIKPTPDKYSGLLSMRFKYVFIDEYQDCDEKQRRVLDSVFDPDRCAVMKIGDPDQAIFNSIYSQTDGWIPKDGFLPVMSSCRYGQEIADFICKLKKNVRSISTTSGMTGLKPVLIVFDNNSIGKVIETFSQILDRHGINERDGVYKAIGAIKKNDTVGKKIGSYWPEFDSTAKSHEEYRYWGLIDIIVKEILDGRIYIAEQTVRKLLCRVFHYVKSLNYTLTTMKQYLDTSFKEIYRQRVYEMLMMNNVDRMSVHNLVLQLLKDLFPTYEADIFSLLPEFFTDDSDCNVVRNSGERNIWIDVASGRKIVVDTIHSVKGETHDATLYLETDFKNQSDLERILPFFGAGVMRDNNLVDRSRKLAYVGMSRPRKLLCVAMCAETYEKIKCKSVFSEWEIEDLRGLSCDCS